MSVESFRAFQAVTDGEEVSRGVVTMSSDGLPDDGVLVEVHWSSVNYKDGLASTPTGRVARISPLVPGVDLSGVLVEDAPGIPAGTEVIAHGYSIGVGRHGGYAEYARVPSDWLVALPEGLTTREAMVLGTGGFTAARSVMALQEHGVIPESGPVLVTGATGGVGSTAVDMLSNLGYEVVASTGKPEAAQFLTDLGASSIVDRSELSEESRRPLESTVWAGAVDCVGGVTLANVLKRIDYGGSVAASGLTGGPGLPATVMPFILRGVNLLGIDSVELPMDRRRATWERLAADLKPSNLDDIGHDITLDELDDVLAAILRGEAKGRSVVDLRA
ncbi:MAG: oxidoreductase [Ilumatobacter sp.]|uniref:oxidoreductase n=1 Tax=Ilumatobacter sp. TaxID=1967498 RepID=UPI002635F879|nr:oxidoreductase [Ilumatobacter sp.]MDJ0768221.1 oxidoreductase [Ilumatobacter sp.]